MSNVKTDKAKPGEPGGKKKDPGAKLSFFDEHGNLTEDDGSDTAMVTPDRLKTHPYLSTVSRLNLIHWAKLCAVIASTGSEQRALDCVPSDDAEDSLWVIEGEEVLLAASKVKKSILVRIRHDLNTPERQRAAILCRIENDRGSSEPVFESVRIRAQMEKYAQDRLAAIARKSEGGSRGAEIKTMKAWGLANSAKILGELEGAGRSIDAAASRVGISAVTFRAGSGLVHAADDPRSQHHYTGRMYDENLISAALGKEAMDLLSRATQADTWKKLNKGASVDGIMKEVARSEATLEDETPLNQIQASVMVVAKAFEKRRRLAQKLVRAEIAKQKDAKEVKDDAYPGLVTRSQIAFAKWLQGVARTVQGDNVSKLLPKIGAAGLDTLTKIRTALIHALGQLPFEVAAEKPPVNVPQATEPAKAGETVIASSGEQQPRAKKPRARR